MVFGYGVAQAMEQVLEQCGDDLTRENIMKQAANLKTFELDVLLPGIKIKTSPTDFAPIEQLADDALQGRELGIVRGHHQCRTERIEGRLTGRGLPGCWDRRFAPGLFD